MNANELADELENKPLAYGNDIQEWLGEAATMLRQQHTSLISDVEVIERQYKEIQVKDEAIFNSQKQAYNLAMQVQNQKFEIEALKAHPVNPYKAITDTKIEPTVVSYTHPVTEHFEDEPQAEELHEIMQSNLELTDEEIHQAIRRGFSRDGFLSDGIFLEIKELLRNKQGVNNEQVPDFFFMENDLMGKR